MNIHDINEERARRERERAERDEELDRISRIDNDIDRTEEIREFIRNHPGTKTPDVESVIKKLRAAKKEQAKKAASAKLKEQAGKPQVDGRIVVSHIVGRPDLNADACIVAMKQRGALVYRRGNKCVRIEGADTNDPSMSVIDSAEAMVETIAPHVVYMIEGDIIDPPANVAKTIMHRTRAALPPPFGTSSARRPCDPIARYSTRPAMIRRRNCSMRRWRGSLCRRFPSIRAASRRWRRGMCS